MAAIFVIAIPITVAVMFFKANPNTKNLHIKINFEVFGSDKFYLPHYLFSYLFFGLYLVHPITADVPKAQNFSVTTLPLRPQLLHFIS